MMNYKQASTVSYHSGLEAVAAVGLRTHVVTHDLQPGM
jgi:hypothetical protein